MYSLVSVDKIYIVTYVEKKKKIGKNHGGRKNSPIKKKIEKNRSAVGNSSTKKHNNNLRLYKALYKYSLTNINFP